MIHWNSRIYMDDKVKKKPYKYRRIIERKKYIKSCYLITLPINEKNCMDLYSTREIWFRYRCELNLEIIGIASNKDSALDLIAQIVQDIMNSEGMVTAESVKSFFEA